MSRVLPNHVLITANMLECGYEPFEIRRILTLGTIPDLFVLECALTENERGRVDFGQMDLHELSELCFSKCRLDIATMDQSLLDLGDTFSRLHQIAVGR